MIQETHQTNQKKRHKKKQLSDFKRKVIIVDKSFQIRFVKKFVSITILGTAIATLIILGFYYFTYKHGGRDLSRYLVEIGMEEGININVTDKNGQIPLHLSTDPRITELLINNGSNINIQDLKGRTPLHMAAFHNRLDVAAVLLERGANMNIKDEEGKTPLDLFISIYHSNSIIWWAGIGNISALIEAFKAKENINAQDKDKNTALHTAIKYKRWEVVNVLLEMGIEIGLKNNEGLDAIEYFKKLYQSTELHFWVYANNLKNVEMVVKHNPNLVNIQDNQGRTPLHIAAIQQNAPISQVLLNAKASCSIRDIDRKKVLEYVKQSGNDMLLKIFYSTPHCQ